MRTAFHDLPARRDRECIRQRSRQRRLQAMGQQPCAAVCATVGIVYAMQIFIQPGQRLAVAFVRGAAQMLFGGSSRRA